MTCDRDYGMGPHAFDPDTAVLSFVAGACPPRAEDADFLAAAHTDVPARVAEVRRLRRRLAQSADRATEGTE